MQQHRFGIDIDRLGDLIGTITSARGDAVLIPVIVRDEYRLEQVKLRTGATRELSSGEHQTMTLFVEEGELQAGNVFLRRGELLQIGPASRIQLYATFHATAYVFGGPADSPCQQSGPERTFDSRSKYWGSIETVVNGEYTGKRLFFRKGQHSSLHFHCAKNEAYYIHSGCLLMRLRAGRGEDRFFKLAAGSTLLIPPGLMHQSGAIEDTVIIEVSTHDEDSDSFLVEDGQRSPMPRLKQFVAAPECKPRRIVFDLDGCLCTQTEGDYENAQPVAEAIALVNRLFVSGHEIVIHTSRFMGRCKNDVAQVYNQGFAFSEAQLRDWGVRYHQLVMGKPRADLLIDDRAVFFRPNWKEIEREIISAEEYTQTQISR